MNRIPLAAGVLTFAVALAACGDDGPGLTAPAATVTATATRVRAPSDVAETVEVVVLDNSFRPNELTVAAGTEVRFVNRGRNEHNVLSVEGDGWGVETVDFGPGAVYTHVFDEPGPSRYYCSLHGNADAGMVGLITVEAAGE